MTKSEAAVSKFIELLEATYNPEAPRVEFVSNDDGLSGAIVLLGEGGDADTATMIYRDMLIKGDPLSVAATMAMEATEERPAFLYDKRYDEPILSFLVHLDRPHA